MPKTTTFIARESKSGEFSATIKKETNQLLTIYCRINNLNKTKYINDILAKDMADKFAVLEDKEND